MVADLAAPHLRQDEQIVMTVYANVGSVSVKRVIATAAVVRPWPGQVLRARGDTTIRSENF